MNDIFCHIHQAYLLDNEMIPFFYTCQSYYALLSHIKPHPPVHVNEFLSGTCQRSLNKIIVEKVDREYDLCSWQFNEVTQIASTTKYLQLGSVVRFNYVQTYDLASCGEYAFLIEQSLEFNHQLCERLNIDVHKPIHVKTNNRNIIYLKRYNHGFKLYVDDSLKMLTIIAPEILFMSNNTYATSLTHISLQCNSKINLAQLFGHCKSLIYLRILSTYDKGPASHDIFDRKTHLFDFYYNYGAVVTLPNHLQHFIHSGRFDTIQFNFGATLKTLHVWRCDGFTNLPSCQHVVHNDKTQSEFIEHFKI